MPTMRGKGEGSIRKRATGRWEGRYTGSDGRQHSVYAKTRADLQVRLAQAIREQSELGFVTGPRQTLAQYLTHWCDNVKAARLKPRTMERYRGVIRSHVIPAIGHLTLAKVTPQHLERLYAQMRVSPASIRYTHQVLHSAFAHALRVRVISRNPAAGVAPPKPSQREMLYLDPAEARAFLGAVVDDPLGPLYALALTSGLRLGELLALRWSDVDLSHATLAVRHTLHYMAGRWSLTEPKTPRSRRQVALSETALAAIRRQKARQAADRLGAGEAWTDHGFVFADAFGEPLHGSRITERRLRPLLKSYALPSIRFHDLRHTAATLMLAGGVNPKVVSEMLGHASVAITLDRYSHVIPSMQEDAARRMDQVLSDAG